MAVLCGTRWAGKGTWGPLKTNWEPLKKVSGLWQKSYHERLGDKKLTSVERRVERYMILYIWKSVNGFVPSLGLSWSNKTGHTLKVDPIKGNVLSVKTLKSNSLKQHGAAIFDMLPNDLKTLKGTQFKNKLDSFISIFPDKPHVDGISTGATSLEGDPSNSLHDWIRILDWD